MAFFVQLALKETVCGGAVEYLGLEQSNSLNTPDVVEFLTERVLNDLTSLLLEVGYREEAEWVGSDDELITKHQTHIVEQVFL